MYRGSCLCGSIQYAIDSGLKAVVNCHCRFCRKAHGASFTTLLFMPFKNLEITAGDEFLGRYHMERVNADRCFCAKCGTRLFNHAPAVGMISLVVATLEVDGGLRAVAHINTESKSPDYAITDELPQFASMPNPAELTQLLSS